MRLQTCMMLLVIACALMNPDVVAQEKPTAPERSVRVSGPDTSAPSSVPQISLPEFEIAGEEIIRIGNRTKTISDEQWSMRSTTIGPPTGPYETQLRSLGGSATAALPGSVGGLTGRAYAGYGTFRTPSLEFWLGTSTESLGLLLKSAYESSAGHVEHADYRTGEGSLSARYGIGEESLFPGVATISGEIGFQGDAYRLYGSETPAVERTVNMFSTEAVLGSDVGEDFSYDVKLALVHASFGGDLDSRETELGGSFAAEKRIDGTTISGSVEGWRNFYSLQDPILAGAEAGVRHVLTSELNLNAGAEVFVTRGTSGSGTVRFFPVAGISWHSADWLTLSARYAPTISRVTLASMLERSPYLAGDVGIFHTEYHTNLELSADIMPRQGLTGRLGFKYQRARNVPLYDEVNSSTAMGDGAGVWNIDYSGLTRIFGFDAEISSELFGTAEAMVSFSWRDIHNSTTGGPIPYAPAVQVGGLYRHRFPYAISLQTDLKILGRQYTSISGTQSIPAFAVWDVAGEYELFSRMVIGLALRNIFNQNQERWRSYVGRPRTVELFGRYDW